MASGDSREGDVAVLGEHGRDHVDDDVAAVSDWIGLSATQPAHSLVLSVAVVSTKMFFVLPATIFESVLSACSTRRICPAVHVRGMRSACHPRQTTHAAS